MKNYVRFFAIGYVFALGVEIQYRLLAADPLGPGDHTRTLMVGELERSCDVHVPPKKHPMK